MRIKFGGLFFLLVFSQLSFGQQLMLSDIMRGEDFIGYSPSELSWSSDGEKIYFYWNPENLVGRVPYQYDLKTNQITKVLDTDLPSTKSIQRFFSRDGRTSASTPSISAMI